MPEIEINTKLNIIKKNSEVSWFIADKWFRILEFSLILAALRYFETITNNLSLTIIYWLSWMFLWSWFEDISKFIVEIINVNKKLSKNNRVVVWTLCTIFVMIIYLLVTHAADSMVSKQYL
ncbi:MAG TPA: hypothetical protein DCS20_01820 [Candidatus Yonathbacteria bacterium]|nr:hypothetical protein [Candidatus Yonathbacteria bacterium]